MNFDVQEEKENSDPQFNFILSNNATKKKKKTF
jgi:hypothetical protein